MDFAASTIRARASADRTAKRHGVSLRTLDTASGNRAGERLLSEVWRTGPQSPPIAADVLQALSDAGGYVTGAFDDATGGSRLLGVCVGFWGPPDRPGMHSHLLGVAPAARGRDVGLALKLDQRAHALERGAREITWTFDPLVARNAHFNLRKLGGTAQAYLIDHYGPLPDGLNRADESDRLLLRWDLLDERVRVACDADTRPAVPGPGPAQVLLSADGDRPQRRPGHGAPGGDAALIAVPADIEALRERNPAAARQWRSAVREVLAPLLAGGARLTDFDRVSGEYVLAAGRPA